jgi:hypothetical protein
VRPMGRPRPSMSFENQFFLSTDGYGLTKNPPSVIRNGWYGWSKPPIRHANRMVWVNGLGMRERRGRSVTPKTDKTAVGDSHWARGQKNIFFKKKMFPKITTI